MKGLLLFLLISTLLSRAKASGPDFTTPFEDKSEFLMKVSAPAIDAAAPVTIPFLRNTGTWGYSFMLINSKGHKRVFTQFNRHVMLKPASLMKIFTGWWALNHHAETDSYLGKMLKESNNAMASGTFYELGGASGIENYFHSFIPVAPYNFRPIDGSGLSHDNKASVQIMMQLLEHIRFSPKYARFKKLLAEPRKKGTLEKRLSEFSGKLFAKTGTLDGVAALSGFLETTKGTLVFCIVSNDLSIKLPVARQKIDTLLRQQVRAVMLSK